MKKEKQQNVPTIGGKVRDIHNAIKTHVNAHRNQTTPDLTAMQTWVIGFLYGKGDTVVYQKHVEEEFKISRATASNMLGLMEKKGLIERKPVESDARLKRLVLTQKAINIHNYVMEDIRLTESTIVKGMTKEEVAIFKDLLDRALNNLLEKGSIGKK